MRKKKKERGGGEGSEAKQKKKKKLTLSLDDGEHRKLFLLPPLSLGPNMRRLTSLATAQTAAAGSQFVQKSKSGAVGAFSKFSFLNSPSIRS